MSDKQSKVKRWESRLERKGWWERFDIILRQRMENEMQRIRENRNGDLTAEKCKKIDFLQEVNKQTHSVYYDKGMWILVTS